MAPFLPSPINTCCHATVHRHQHSSASEEGKGSVPTVRGSEQSTPSAAEHHETAEAAMSRGSTSKGGRGGGVDLNLNLNLKLHLSPPARGTEGAAAAAASSLSSDEWSSSSPSSCLSSEGEREPQQQQRQRHNSHGLQWSDSPEATSMVLAACPRCLMYVMLSEADPRCPRCRSPVLLDFLHHAAAARNSSSREEDDDDHSGGGGGRNRRA